uniref:Selenoprotein O n=1 Tax=Strigamia maritima TaxID=126957 RepID=T1JEC3_STRMM
MMSSLETLNFDNQTIKSLPLDDTDDNSIRQVVNACFTVAEPTPVEEPEIIAYSIEAMNLLDLPENELQRPLFIDYFSGNVLIPGSQPAAHCYCGYQCGVFCGQLGDGAVMYLGEVVNKNGERWELQLKGCGKTPFSRNGDGRKTLRSSIREFLCCEAMYHLGIPTTRAGACITSKTLIDRDVFCDGNMIKEKATIVTRIAPTFLRFGSFEICLPKSSEYAKCGPSVGENEILLQLLEYTIKNYFPQIQVEFATDTDKKYKQFFKEVLLRTAELVASWQCVGFCHGMLNTDNMSILGLTIDYGPFCFMDYFNPDHIPNSIDFSCRSAASKQPEICHWNLMKLAETLQPCLISDTFESELDLYWQEYNKFYMNIMHKKVH